MRLFVVLPPLLLVSSLACTSSEVIPGPQGPGVEIVAEVESPVDATPSADGLDIYVVTDSASGSELLELRAGEVTSLATFLHARAVVTDSSDSVVVADTGMDVVFEFELQTGITSMIEGTEGLGARALHLGDALYIAGETGLWSVPREGAAMAEMVATGFPGFIDGVTQADDGTLYVTGEGATGAGVTGGALFEIVDGAPVVVAEDIHLGTPSGVAITPDDTTVMVSALSETGTSQVVLVSREDGSTSIFDDVIKENTDSGGLHRAADDPTVFAWVDSAGGLGGGIHRVTF